MGFPPPSLSPPDQPRAREKKSFLWSSRFPLRICLALPARRPRACLVIATPVGEVVVIRQAPSFHLALSLERSSRRRPSTYQVTKPTLCLFSLPGPATTSILRLYNTRKYTTSVTTKASIAIRNALSYSHAPERKRSDYQTDCCLVRY